MCRVEERVYIGHDGRRQTFEESFPCDKARGKKLCSKVKRRTTEYYPKVPPISRDDASSPASNNPPTPTGTGSYLVEERRPSGATERRPSIKQAVKPQIIIEIGRKDGKKYPSMSVYPKVSKRSSLGAGSDVAVESPGSDASYTVRTGLPETPVVANDPFHHSQGYTTRHSVPQGHRHTSSASSFTTSSQPPSLYATSEPESPSTRRPARYPPTIVHNPFPGGVPSSPTAARTQPQAPSSPYRTTIISPQGSSRDNIAPDGLSPLDYSDFVDNSTSSYASSGRAAAPEITDRGVDRERMRKQKADDRKRQEEADRRFAEELVKEEEKKQVRFELGRAEGRAQQRGENKLAESEKIRAEERDRERRRKHKERDDRAAAELKREKVRLHDDIARKEREIKDAEATMKRESRPTTNRRSRKPSISQADIEERNRLLLETQAQMAREREATEQREREERAALLREQQQTTQYYDPRGGERYPVPNNGPGFGRRNSVTGRRPSISNPPPPSGLSRSNSHRRVSVSQPNPPPIDTRYSTRPPSSHYQNPPPFFPPTSTRPPSARHSSYDTNNPFAPGSMRTSQDNPFAQPPTRTSQENPFAQPGTHHSRDPWDTREMQDSLTGSNSSGHTRHTSEDRRDKPRTIRSRGEDVISRAAREATRSMQKAVGYEDDYEDSDSGNSADKIAGYGPRLGLGKGGKRRN